MAICRKEYGGCGAEDKHVVTHFDSKTGNVVREECSRCSQSLDPVTPPSDKKVWMGWETKPHLYKKTEEGYEAKDELLADQHAWVLDPDPIGRAERERATEEAKEEKRRLSRKQVTRDEAAVMKEAADKWAEDFRRKRNAELAGLILP